MVRAVDGEHVRRLGRRRRHGRRRVERDRLEAELVPDLRRGAWPARPPSRRRAPARSSITAKWPRRIDICESSMFPSRSSRASLIAATIPGRSRPIAVTAKSPTNVRYADLVSPADHRARTPLGDSGCPGRNRRGGARLRVSPDPERSVRRNRAGRAAPLHQRALRRRARREPTDRLRASFDDRAALVPLRRRPGAEHAGAARLRDLRLPGAGALLRPVRRQRPGHEEPRRGLRRSAGSAGLRGSDARRVREVRQGRSEVLRQDHLLPRRERPRRHPHRRRRDGLLARLSGVGREAAPGRGRQGATSTTRSPRTGSPATTSPTS